MNRPRPSGGFRPPAFTATNKPAPSAKAFKPVVSSFKIPAAADSESSLLSDSFFDESSSQTAKPPKDEGDTNSTMEEVIPGVFISQKVLSQSTDSHISAVGSQEASQTSKPGGTEDDHGASQAGGVGHSVVADSSDAFGLEDDGGGKQGQEAADDVGDSASSMNSQETCETEESQHVKKPLGGGLGTGRKAAKADDEPPKKKPRTAAKKAGVKLAKTSWISDMDEASPPNSTQADSIQMSINKVIDRISREEKPKATRKGKKSKEAKNKVLGQPKTSSKKDKGEALKNKMMELLTIRDDGTWVQCNDCEKWRLLDDIKDPSEIPEVWRCLMRSDVGGCDAAEADFDEYARSRGGWVELDYTAGSVVWAKLEGWPWWPALVDDDPDTMEFFWTDYGREQSSWYHVVFFDRKATEVTRAWIPANLVKPMKPDQLQPPSGPISKAQSVKREAAISEAGKALQIDLMERRRRFSFVSTFKGKWGDFIDWTQFTSAETQDEAATSAAEMPADKLVDENSSKLNDQNSLLNEGLEAEP